MACRVTNGRESRRHHNTPVLRALRTSDPKWGRTEWNKALCTRVLLSLHLMASRIVSWSGDEHIVSPNLSKTPSIISVDSIISEKSEGSEPQLTHTASQAIELNEIRTSTSTTIYPGTDAAYHDGSFMQHNKYFFKDGNVTFLVRDVQS